MLAKRAHYSVASLSQAASGRDLPSLAVTIAFVRACGGDVDEWERRWRELSAADLVVSDVPVPVQVSEIARWLRKGSRLHDRPGDRRRAWHKRPDRPVPSRQHRQQARRTPASRARVPGAPLGLDARS
jgi:hypothetical protein